MIVSLSDFEWGRLGPSGIVGSWAASTSHSPRHWPRGAWYVQLAVDGPLEAPLPPPQRLSLEGNEGTSLPREIGGSLSAGAPVAISESIKSSGLQSSFIAP